MRSFFFVGNGLDRSERFRGASSGHGAPCPYVRAILGYSCGTHSCVPRAVEKIVILSEAKNL